MTEETKLSAKAKAALKAEATKELWAAIDANDERRVKLLAKKAYLTARREPYGDTPLHAAARLGRAPLGRHLIDAGADKESFNDEKFEGYEKGKRPWEVAQTKGFSASTWGPFKHHQTALADNSRDEQTKKLFDAIEKDNLDGMSAAIGKGADANYHAQKGRTPLHKAAMRGNVGAVQLLLDKNADHKLVDGVGYTAEAVALYQYTQKGGREGHKQSAKILAKQREKHGGPEPKITISKSRVTPSGLPGMEYGKGVDDTTEKVDPGFSWRNTQRFTPRTDSDDKGR